MAAQVSLKHDSFCCWTFLVSQVKFVTVYERHSSRTPLLDCLLRWAIQWDAHHWMGCWNNNSFEIRRKSCLSTNSLLICFLLNEGMKANKRERVSAEEDASTAHGEVKINPTPQVLTKDSFLQENVCDIYTGGWRCKAVSLPDRTLARSQRKELWGNAFLFTFLLLELFPLLGEKLCVFCAPSFYLFGSLSIWVFWGSSLLRFQSIKHCLEAVRHQRYFVFMIRVSRRPD